MLTESQTVVMLLASAALVIGMLLVTLACHVSDVRHARWLKAQGYSR